MVQDELQMEILLKFLIMETNTFDSNKDSLNFLKRYGFISKKLTPLILVNRIYAGYLVMKIRMKIGFEIAIKR